MKKRNNKFINLNYILDSSHPVIKEYLKYNGTNFDNNDIDVLSDFVKVLSLIASKRTLQHFILGYKIERLDKEFDLIKMDSNVIVNIELKEKYEDLKQAMDNYNTLNIFYPNLNIYVFCYCKNDTRVYLYNNEDKKFEDSDIQNINEKLENLIVPEMMNINFQVYSIYRNPNFFLNNEYCLSTSQKNTFDSIMRNLEHRVIVIQGDAGVGKSLLALFLHKTISVQCSSAFLAPIKINNIVDRELISKHGISTVKDFISKKETMDYIIIDEAQNLSEYYVDELLKLCNKTLILFGDRLQDIKSIGYFDILCADKNNKVLNMKKIIRTNNTFVAFAKRVLNIDVPRKTDVNPSKIDIKMCDDDFDLKEYVYIEPLKSLYFPKCTNNGECDHKKCLSFKYASAVLKQFNDIDTCSLEYENVVIYLCHSYKLVEGEDGKKHIVSTKRSSIYTFEKELYLMMTRAISKLLIITDDLEVYNYLMLKKEQL